MVYSPAAMVLIHLFIWETRIFVGKFKLRYVQRLFARNFIAALAPGEVPFSSARE
ncbi:MAG: hypothetical protein R2865_10025 [Deinococcales bacterium]